MSDRTPIIPASQQKLAERAGYLPALKVGNTLRLPVAISRMWWN